MSKTTKPGAPTEPVDASAVSQESALEKPSREELAKSGYVFPEAFDALEEAGGDLEKAGEIVREKVGAMTQDEVNAQADAVQRAAMKRAGRVYNVPGQKNAGGPAENKALIGAITKEKEPFGGQAEAGAGTNESGAAEEPKAKKKSSRKKAGAR